MWLCLKLDSKNIVLVRLLQIGGKDLTVRYQLNWPAASHKKRGWGPEHLPVYKASHEDDP